MNIIKHWPERAHDTVIGPAEKGEHFILIAGERHLARPSDLQRSPLVRFSKREEAVERHHEHARTKRRKKPKQSWHRQSVACATSRPAAKCCNNQSFAPAMARWVAMF
jgi:hypothetical protein